MVIAAQLWIFSQMPHLDENIAGLLRGLGEAGYEAIEGLAGKAPHDSRPLQTTGVAYAATHLTTASLEPLDPLLNFLNEADIRHVCSSGPMQWNARTADDFGQTAVFLNEKGHRLRENGVRLHYHNHEFEFEEMEGTGRQWICYFRNLIRTP